MFCTENKATVKIICKEHGVFEQRVSCHLIGQGCAKCYGNIKSTTSDFIKKAKLKHGDRYDYTLVKYKEAFKKIIIICNEHGEFEQTPCSHLKGSGCKKCKSTSDNNVLYLWQAEGVYYNGVQVYKIGVTSERLKVKRIYEVAKKHGYNAIIVAVIPLNNASALELEIKKLGVKPDVKKIDGYSEFRAFTDEEVNLILAVAKDQ